MPQFFDPNQSLNAFASGEQMGGDIRNKQTANALAPMVASGDYESAMAYAASRGDLAMMDYVRPQAEAAKSKALKQGIGNALASGDFKGATAQAYGAGDIDTGMALYGHQRTMKADEITDQKSGIDYLVSNTDALMQIPENDPRRADEAMRIIMDSPYGQDPNVVSAVQSAIADGKLTNAELKQFQQQLLTPAQRIEGQRYDAEQEYTQGRDLAADRAGQEKSENVQGQFVTEDGYLGYLTRGGKKVVTDIKVRNNYGIIDMGGGVRGAFDPRAGTATPLMSPEEVGYNAATVETSKANEAARVEAEQGLPEAMSKWNIGISTLEALRDSPGFDSRYGIASVIPAIPGTDMADTQALINQMGGQAFLDAFESLKGGGQITQIEGEKATQAMTILTSQGIRVETAAKAIDDLIVIKRAASARAIAKASGTYGTQGPDAPPLVFNPATGDFD
jgi:hypothetical protein